MTNTDLTATVQPLSQIVIHDLVCSSTIGIHDHEKQSPQPLHISLVADYPNFTQACSDHIEDALDYTAISAHIETFCAHHRYELLEPFIEDLAQQLLQQFAISRVELTVCKPQAIAHAKNVGLRVVRWA